MYINILLRGWWAARVGEADAQLERYGFRQVFASRNYGPGLARLLMVLNCFDPAHHRVRQGARMKHAERMLGMELILDFDVMMAGGDDVRRRHITERLREDLTRTLRKYCLKEFDTERFLADFNRWLDTALWLAESAEISDDGPVTPMIATRFLIQRQPIALDESVSEYDRDLFSDIIDWVAEVRDPAIVPGLLGSFGEGDLNGLYEKAMRALTGFDAASLVGPIRDALFSPLDSVQYWAVKLCVAKPMPELSVDLTRIASSDTNGEIKELAKAALGSADSSD